MNAPSALRLDPAAYAPHELHADRWDWKEKNCYIDVWIEVIHALGLDPHAMLPFTLAVDFEGDQWTFFKPSHQELSTLYGLDVQELNLWRPLVEHAQRQVADGRIVLAEADSFYLPDTHGTDYLSNHVKTTIGIASLDRQRRRVCYFHNAGYYRAEGEDFDGLFRTGADTPALALPLFAEFVRSDRRVVHAPAELATLSRRLLRRHLRRMPSDNPVTRFRAAFTMDVEWLKEQPAQTYHGYAFATLRQLGAAFELGAAYLGWLARHGDEGLQPVIADCTAISATCKALILKAARAVTLKKPADFSEGMDTLATAWTRVRDELTRRYLG